MTGWTTALLDGIAADLDTAGIGTWDQDGTSGTIYLGALPPGVDNGVGVQPALLRPDPGQSDVLQIVQFWIRGGEAYVRDTFDAIFTRYEGARDLTFGGIRCYLIHLRSDAQMGVDDRGRRERAAQYDFQANRPTTYRPD